MPGALFIHTFKNAATDLRSSPGNERENSQRISIAQQLIQRGTLAVYECEPQDPFADPQMSQAIADTGTLRVLKPCLLESPEAKTGK